MPVERLRPKGAAKLKPAAGAEVKVFKAAKRDDVVPGSPNKEPMGFSLIELDFASTPLSNSFPSLLLQTTNSPRDSGDE